MGRTFRTSRAQTVAKPELGTKRVCPVTGRKFYDLNKDPIVSPFTGISYPRSAFEAPVRGAPPKVAQAATEEEVLVEPEAGDAELISLEEAEEEENASPAKAAALPDDDIEEIEEDEAAAEDDTFLEEEEDEDTDVADLIDSDIEEEEEP